jgi:hypothetical protein
LGTEFGDISFGSWANQNTGLHYSFSLFRNKKQKKKKKPIWSILYLPYKEFAFEVHPSVHPSIPSSPSIHSIHPFHLFSHSFHFHSVTVNFIWFQNLSPLLYHPSTYIRRTNVEFFIQENDFFLRFPFHISRFIVHLSTSGGWKL